MDGLFGEVIRISQRHGMIERLAGEFGVTFDEMKECLDTSDAIAAASFAAMNVIPVDFVEGRRLDR